MMGIQIENGRPRHVDYDQFSFILTITIVQPLVTLFECCKFKLRMLIRFLSIVSISGKKQIVNLMYLDLA